MNRVFLSGRLVAAPVRRTTAAGATLVTARLAVTSPDSVFVNLSLWGDQAETVHGHLGKGSPLWVEGRVRTDTRGRLEVYVTDFQLVPWDAQ